MIQAKMISILNLVQLAILFLFITTVRAFTSNSIEFTNSMNSIKGPFSKQEYTEMRKEAEHVVNFLVNEVLPQNKTDQSFFKNMTDVKVANHTDSFFCKTCLWTFTKFHNLLEHKYGLTLFDEFLTLLCSIGLDHKICYQAIDLYSTIVIDSIIEHYLDAEYICSRTYICRNEHYIELNPDDYARELLKDKPAKKELKVDQSSSTLKILHLTDFHTDLNYEEGSVGLCPNPLCCRKENGVAKTSQEAAGRWGFEGKCDIPLRTLDLFIETVVNEIKPDMIIWTGDNPPHNPWMKNSDEIYNVTQVFIDLLYNKYQYKGPVFPALGNHEEYIADQYNPYDMHRENGFLKTMGDMFKIWLKEDEYNQFISHGFYSTKYANSNIRIISINCFLCDVMNFYLIRNPTDPEGQFVWLENTLRQAEKDGESVFIIGHIPPGDSTYLSQCSKRYNALVDRFSNIIRGQFYGHTHYDEFRIITDYFNQTNVAGLILTSPSLTSYSWKNPSFRVYEVDSSSKLVKDYKQYRLNLTEANITPDIKPKFKVAYSAKEKFNFEHLNDFMPFRESLEKILSDKEWLNFIMDSFYAQGVEKLSYVNNKKISNYLNCRFKEGVFDDYLKCTGYHTWDYIEYVNRLIESFSGSWYVKIRDEPHDQKNVKFLNTK